MNSTVRTHFDAHQQVVQDGLNAVREPAEQVVDVLIESLKNCGKVLAFGNGGSAAQASHLAAELMGRFHHTREPLPAISLSANADVGTCIGNDFGYDALFERQIQALAEPEDVAVGFTTSGQSVNVLRGLAEAQNQEAIAVALTGASGLANGAAEYRLAVPSETTAHIQEVHLMIVHAWCAALDAEFAR